MSSTKSGKILVFFSGFWKDLEEFQILEDFAGFGKDLEVFHKKHFTAKYHQIIKVENMLFAKRKKKGLKR